MKLINTVQDMIDCTDKDNIDKFLADLKIILTSTTKSVGFVWSDGNEITTEGKFE